MFPTAYVYPRAMRATRDLLRRRTFLVRRRAELLTHIQNTGAQYNLPEFGKPLGMAYKKRLEEKHGRALAMSILSHRLGQAVCFMLKRGQAFDMKTFLPLPQARR